MLTKTVNTRVDSEASIKIEFEFHTAIYRQNATKKRRRRWSEGWEIQRGR